MRALPQSQASRLTQPAVAGDAAAEHDSWRGVGGLGGLDALQEGVDGRFLVARGKMRARLIGDRLAYANLVEQRRLDATEAEVEARGTGSRKADRARIARRGQRVDRRATGERQTQDARSLVEGLARRVIDRPADHRYAAVLLPSDQAAVTAGHDQPEDRRLIVPPLPQRRGDNW